jgi:hypothetical protein
MFPIPTKPLELNFERESEKGRGGGLESIIKDNT